MFQISRLEFDAIVKKMGKASKMGIYFVGIVLIVCGALALIVYSHPSLSNFVSKVRNEYLDQSIYPHFFSNENKMENPYGSSIRSSNFAKTLLVLILGIRVAKDSQLLACIQITCISLVLGFSHNIGLCT